MRDFACPHCGQRLAFENSVCLSCSHGVGFDLDLLDFVVVDRDGNVADDSVRGMCAKSSHQIAVTTGHHSGVITLDLAEGDDVHRERLRISMDEPYRTLLGHFRHEIGHYFFGVLVEGAARRQEFLSLFGDASADYQAALDRHYAQGVSAGWEADYVSFELWIPLSWALDMVNRSMGHSDLYPFALSPRVLDKMAFAHRLVSQVRDEVAAAS